MWIPASVTPSRAQAGGAQVQEPTRRWLRPETKIAVGVSGFCFVVGLILAAPWLPLADPNQVDPPARLLLPLSAGHLLGTDEVGRDLLSRLVWGGRISLGAGLASTAGALLIGLPMGLLSGYLRGPLELFAMRVTDVVLAFPTILLAIAIVAGLGPSMMNAVVAGTIVGFPFYARLVMGNVLSLREREFIVAAQASGASLSRIMCRHVLPNTMETVFVGVSLDVGSKILVMASLSFLGLGTQPPTPDWGTMLASGREFVTSAPHVATLPGVGIFFTVAMLNLLADGVNERLSG